MKYTYRTSGTCSIVIELEVEKGIVKEVLFIGGYHGNQQGISSPVKGMKSEEVISRLEGIRCGKRFTSCPDQLSKALKEFK
ncbi:MAG: TIGR03905 family TSCPD domain-containing protein [Bacteroides sp.]|nr:TIGR03905 family TSCPD domain-containing protein [Bacteroides sp.]